MNDSETLSAKEKAALFVELGKSAQERFNIHHGVEWKISFGLWAFFLGGVVYLTTTDAPTLCGLELIALSAVAAVLLGVYWLWWLPHSHQYREECTRTRWWWESCSIPERQWRLPGELLPDGWRVPLDEDWCKWGERGWLHSSQMMAVVVTLVFAFLFLGAAWFAVQEPTAILEDIRMALAAGFVGGLLGGVLLSGWFYYKQ